MKIHVYIMDENGDGVFVLEKRNEKLCWRYVLLTVTHYMSKDQAIQEFGCIKVLYRNYERDRVLPHGPTHYLVKEGELDVSSANS